MEFISSLDRLQYTYNIHTYTKLRMKERKDGIMGVVGRSKPMRYSRPKNSTTFVISFFFHVQLHAWLDIVLLDNFHEIQSVTTTYFLSPERNYSTFLYIMFARLFHFENFLLLPTSRRAELFSPIVFLPTAPSSNNSSVVAAFQLTHSVLVYTILLFVLGVCVCVFCAFFLSKSGHRMRIEVKSSWEKSMEGNFLS
jgi:hypothetical protein